MANYPGSVISGGLVAIPLALTPSLASSGDFTILVADVTKASRAKKNPIDSCTINRNRVGFESGIVSVGPQLMWFEFDEFEYTWNGMDSLMHTWRDFEPGGPQIQLHRKRFTHDLKETTGAFELKLKSGESVKLLENDYDTTLGHSQNFPRVGDEAAQPLQITPKIFIPGDNHVNYDLRISGKQDFNVEIPLTQLSPVLIETSHLMLHTNPSINLFKYVSQSPIRLSDAGYVFACAKIKNEVGELMPTFRFSLPVGNSHMLNLLSGSDDFFIRLFMSSILYKHIGSGLGFDVSDLLLFPIDWSEGIKEKYSWLTNIITSYDGTEQRIALREFPKWSLEYKVLAASAEESNKLDSFLWKRATQVIGVPLWTDATKLLQDAAVGDSKLYVKDLGLNRFEAGSKVILYKNSDLFEVVGINTCVGDIINLSGVLQGDWEAFDTIVMPIRTGRIPESFSIDRLTSEYSSTTLNIDMEVVGR